MKRKNCIEFTKHLKNYLAKQEFAIAQNLKKETRLPESSRHVGDFNQPDELEMDFKLHIKKKPSETSHSIAEAIEFDRAANTEMDDATINMHAHNEHKDPSGCDKMKRDPLINGAFEEGFGQASKDSCSESYQDLFDEHFKGPYQGVFLPKVMNKCKTWYCVGLATPLIVALAYLTGIINGLTGAPFPFIGLPLLHPKTYY